MPSNSRSRMGGWQTPSIGKFRNETNPSIAVLYFKSISYAQLQRDFPKTVKTTGKLGFYSFSMFNKMSGDVDDIVNGTFYNEDVRHAIGEYMRKERFCKVFTNTNRTGIESDYSLTEFTRSLPFDSCSDDNTIAERLIEAWTRFSIDNTDNCYLSHIFVNNTYWSKSLDSTLSHAMIQFQLNNVFQKTLVLILSAEGIPVGQFGNSYTGKVEERNPILLAHVPPKLRTLYPDHVFQIEQNQNKLITHKDVFELLNSFVRLSKGQTIQPTDPEFVEWRMEHKRGVSLWQSLLPTKRTCVEAMIPDEFCLCMEHMLEQERIYNETDNMAATLYQKMDTEIRARHPCIQETTRVADRNYTLVHNLNSAILNGTDEYVEFLLFTVHAYSNGLSAEKNFFISVNGQFKHMLNGERDIRQAYPYVTDGTGSMCMAGFMDRFCEMCHRKFYMSPP
uniref:Uncharacterized protein n=1 Tax=Caenorhabditis japonica TaxID=281687 RepID=A0A8R1DU26_CAEJA